MWEELCGVYFRFPVEDDEESYWDDDYDGKKSFNSWLKQKYTGPYFVYCSRDSYVENQLLVDQFNTEFRQSTKTKPAKNLNEFVQQIWLAESFFATFKKEELYHREYHSYEELKKGIDEYILFYNQVRPHKKLKYVSPCEFEEAYYKNLQS